VAALTVVITSRGSGACNGVVECPLDVGLVASVTAVHVHPWAAAAHYSSVSSHSHRHTLFVSRWLS
jgi:hypothetical protein